MIISFCAPSKTGKTTFLKTLVGALVKKKRRVGVLKHCHHPLHARADSDSQILGRAGAQPAIAITHNDFQQMTQYFKGCDVLLVEGFRSAELPAFVLFRGARDTGWKPPKNIVGRLDLRNKETCINQVCCYIEQELST